MATINDEIRSKIETFATDVAVLVNRAALEAVMGALGGGEPVAPPRPAVIAKPAAPARPAVAKKPAPIPAPRAKTAAPVKAPARAAPASRATTRVAPPKRPLGAKRPPAELARLVERLGEYIKANPGLGIEAIGKALATPTSELTLPIKKLIAAKRIRFEGHKRATRYFPI